LLMSLLQLMYEHVKLSIAGLTPDSHTAAQLRLQHRALFEAIDSGNGPLAANCAHEHMEFVRTRLNDIERPRGRR
jgi:GntR family transcriptional repressor for pyruvate dehydrogenase complex